MVDRPIHLEDYKNIVKIGSFQEPSVIVPVCITQSTLDGIHALLKIIEGMKLQGSGEIGGAFELISFYRILRSSINEANNKNAPTHSLQAEER